jgi:hypothetical protein
MSRGSTPCATARRSASRDQSRTAWFTKRGTNVTMQVPPLPASRASTSSGTLRGWSHTSYAEEWLKITGAVAVSRASRIVAWLTWERSTIIPIRFISRTTPRPSSLRPPSTGSSVAESAHGTLSLWVSVR